MNKNSNNFGKIVACNHLAKPLYLLIFFAIFYVSPVFAFDFFITSYDFSYADTSKIASKYTLVITSDSRKSAVTEIKAINSLLKALWYRDALCFGNSYPVLDTVTGNRIHRNGWEWELQDISNASYRSALAQGIHNYLYENSQFDGIFLDDVLHDLYDADFHDSATGKQANLPQDLKTNWRNYMILLLKEIKTTVQSKLLIANTNFYMIQFINEVDGIMDEWFGHPNWDNATTWNYDGNWKDSINAMVSIVRSGKYFLAQSGVKDGATQEQIDTIMKFCYASFLMGADSAGKAKHYFTPSLRYSKYYWYSDWEINLGNPTSQYFQIIGTNVYRRNFEKGIVLVNIGTQQVRLSLEGYFYDSHGKLVTEINLLEHGSSVLLNYVLQSTPKRLKLKYLGPKRQIFR